MMYIFEARPGSDLYGGMIKQDFIYRRIIFSSARILRAKQASPPRSGELGRGDPAATKDKTNSSVMPIDIKKLENVFEGQFCQKCKWISFK